MKIVDLLVKERIILDLKAKNKAEAINELAGFLEGAEEVVDLNRFLKDVFERESSVQQVSAIISQYHMRVRML